MSEVLVQASRNGFTERVHQGDLAVVDAGGRIVAYAGDPCMTTFMRSAAKPLQAMAVIQTGAADAYGLSDDELAVTCASHSAEPCHVEAVRSILAKAGCSEAMLRCGSHPPGNAKAREALYMSGKRPSEVHSNCSGKHSGMLAICAHMGWPDEDYRLPDHPLQQMLLEHVAFMAGVPVENIPLGVDGCGVVVHALGVASMAYAFARLATGEGLGGPKAAAAARIRTAMRAHPVMVSGTGRICAALNGISGKAMISKGGALGVYCAASADLGVGVSVKIADGNGQAAGVAALEALNQLGAFDAEDLEKLGSHHHPQTQNVPGQVVGEVRPVFQLRRTKVV